MDFKDTESLKAHKKSPEGRKEKLIQFVKTVNICAKTEEVHFTAEPGGPPPDNKVTVEPGHTITLTVSLGSDRQFYGNGIWVVQGDNMAAEEVKKVPLGFNQVGVNHTVHTVEGGRVSHPPIKLKNIREVTVTVQADCRGTDYIPFEPFVIVVQSLKLNSTVIDHHGCTVSSSDTEIVSKGHIMIENLFSPYAKDKSHKRKLVEDLIKQLKEPK